MNYDIKCYELAEHFLRDEKNVTELKKKELARYIQSAIEGWFDDEVFDE